MKGKILSIVGITLTGILFLVGCKVPISGEIEKTIYVGPEIIPCEGEAPQMCLQVKENPLDEYTYFYDQIEGFNFEAGYEYVIRISEETIDSPPAGGSSIRWVLLEVISKTSVSEDQGVGFIEEQEWVLVSYENSQGENTAVIRGSGLTARFAGGQITGSAGCNNYFGFYQIDGNQISLSEIGATEMYCGEPEGIMQQEADYVQALTKIAAYELAGDQLKLIDAQGNGVLLFSKMVHLALVGPNWLLDFYNNGDGAFVSVLAGTEISAQFDEKGYLSGSAGCNTYNSTYVIETNSITIASASVTRMACESPEGIMEQEQRYLAALEQAATFEIRGNNLIFTDSNGVRLFSFTATREEEPKETPVEGVSDLAGYVWKWIVFSEIDQDDLIVGDPQNYTLEFLPEGDLNIKADCNSTEGSYVVVGDEITIEIINTTTAVCEQGSLSDGFLRLLQSAISYKTEQEYLYLENVNQTSQLIFSNSEIISLPPTPPVTPSPTRTPVPTEVPTATSTPSPTATANPTPIPSPTSLVNPSFEDDFSRHTGWPNFMTATHGFQRDDGYYYIYVGTRNGFVYSVRDQMIMDDVILEAEVAHLDGQETSYYGVVCRFLDGNNYYGLVISAEGSYGILKRERGMIEFIDKGKDQNGVILGDNALNRIRGDCIGDKLTLYVNGIKLLEVTDNDFKEGGIGMLAITFTEKTLLVSYDYFAAYER